MTAEILSRTKVGKFSFSWQAYKLCLTNINNLLMINTQGLYMVVPNRFQNEHGLHKKQES